MNDVAINKIQSIQRCVQRAREEFRSDPEGFDADYTLQDAAILNVLRACFPRSWLLLPTDGIFTLFRRPKTRNTD
jgi:hypothetical protein